MDLKVECLACANPWVDTIGNIDGASEALNFEPLVLGAHAHDELS